MPRLRRIAEIPGLARLLADAPRERRAALARFWEVGSPDQPGAVAALYRRMTDRDQVGTALSRSSEVERLLFARLVGVADGRTPVDLAARLPFSEDAIQDSLRSLEERGLVWKVALAFRMADPEGTRWVVPRDIATSVAPEWRNSRGPRLDEEAGRAAHVAGPVASVERTILHGETINAAGSVRQVLTTLAEGNATRAEPTSIVARAEKIACPWGLALGLLARVGRSIGPGPRAGIWKGLDASEQARALARLWLVDPRLSLGVPMATRSTMAVVLASFEEEVWYGLDSLARVVASRAGGWSGPSAPSEPGARPAASGRSLRRAELEHAVETLNSLGVLDVATDGRKRPVAVRLSHVGKFALG